MWVIGVVIWSEKRKERKAEVNSGLGGDTPP